VLLSFLGIAGAIALAPVVALPVLVGGFVDYLHLSESEAGFLVSVNLAGIALSSLVVALRVHHYPLRLIAVTGIALLIAGDLLTTFSNSINQLTLSRLISGIGGGILSSAVLAAMAILDNNNRAYGIFAAFQVIIGSGLLYAFPVVLRELGTQGVFGALVVMEVCIVLGVGIFNLYTRSSDAKEVSPEFSTLVQPSSLKALVALGTFGLANAAVWAYIERMGATLALSAEEAGTALGIAALLSASGGFLAFAIGANFRRSYMVLIGVVVQGASLTLLLVTNGFVGYFLIALMFNTAWSFNLPQFQGIQAEIDQRGSIVVAGQFTNMAGFATGPALAALLVEPESYESAILLAVVFYTLSLVLVLPMLRKSEFAEAIASV